MYTDENGHTVTSCVRCNGWILNWREPLNYLCHACRVADMADMAEDNDEKENGET
jgi:hypothetical protein